MNATERIGTTKAAGTTSAPPNYSQRMVAAGEAVALDFSAEWAQIRRDLLDEADAQRVQADRWLRIGRNLIKVRDALKPLGHWLAELEKNGISQPTAWRYTEYAELSESDREIYLRRRVSPSAAVDKRRREKAMEAEPGAAEAGEVSTQESERNARLAEIARQLKLGVAMVEAGETALGSEPPPEHGGDAERWRDELAEVADAVLAVLNGGSLEAALRKRLLPGSGV
jgi:hypothetical protein